MKHIKLFEAYAVYKKIDHFINWKMIEDVKDMALEYIDDGLTLYIGFHPIITYEEKGIYNNDFIELYHLLYNHNMDKFEDGDDSNLFYKYADGVKGMSYFINFVFCGDTNRYGLIYKLALELVNRVKEAYPNEKINTGWFE